MGHIVKHVNADRNKIDAYLGKQHFDIWMRATDESRTELKTIDDFEAFWSPKKGADAAWFKAYFHLTSNAKNDARMVEIFTEEWGIAIEDIQAGRKPNKQQVIQIMDIHRSALQALQIENDLLGWLFPALAIDGVHLFVLGNLARASADAIPKIERLQAALEKAKRQAIEAKVQAAVDGGLFVLTVFLPHLRVLTKVGLAVGQMAMDEILGGPKSTATKDYLSAAGTNASMAQPLVENWSFLNATGKQFAKRAGTALSVAGLYFDDDEVGAALSRVDFIEQELAGAIKELKTVKRLVEQARPLVNQLKIARLAAVKQLRSEIAQSKQKRDEYKSLDKLAGFPSYSPMKWRKYDK